MIYQLLYLSVCTHTRSVESAANERSCYLQYVCKRYSGTCLCGRTGVLKITPHDNFRRRDPKRGGQGVLNLFYCIWRYPSIPRGTIQYYILYRPHADHITILFARQAISTLNPIGKTEDGTLERHPRIPNGWSRPSRQYNTTQRFCFVGLNLAEPVTTRTSTAEKA